MFDNVHAPIVIIMVLKCLPMYVVAKYGFDPVLLSLVSLRPESPYVRAVSST